MPANGARVPTRHPHGLRLYECVLIPLVAIVLAWWLQDERITWAFAAGSILVLIGVYVGALRRPSEERVPEAVRVPSER